MSVSVTHGSTTHLHLWRKTRICIHLVYQYHQREVFAGCATAPRLGMVGCVLPSPHSRLRRQCGVIYNVTARAVNIAGFQFITLIRHLTHNRASGCNINNLTLTTSVAKSATWGPVKHPNNYNRGAVADSAIKGIRVLFSPSILRALYARAYGNTPGARVLRLVRRLPCVMRAYGYTPLQVKAKNIYNHLITSDINNAARLQTQ